MVDVLGARGDLQEMGVEGGAVLAQETDVAVVVDDQYCYRTPVHGHVAIKGDVIVANSATLNVKDSRVQEYLGSLDFERVAHKVTSTDEGSIMCGSRPSARAAAALMRPTKSGWGRSGRDLNSGCAWVPTKNAWPGSSTNSTSRPSGELPEQRSPAASNWSR